jgi:mono/diheme cytochrome c family protein
VKNRTFRMSAVATVIVAGSLGLLGFGQVVRAQDATADSQSQQAQFAIGAQTWADTCDRCHNMRDPKEFRDDQWRSIVSHMRVRGGLTGQEARDVLAFLQQANNVAVVPVVTASTATPAAAASGPAGESASEGDGQAIYAQTCIACHGADGKGAIPGVPDFTAKAGPLSKSDAELVKNISEGFQSPGSFMAMPAKGGNAALTEDDVRAVLAYLRSDFGE